MLATARRQTYRPRRFRGLARMRDLWHFAHWLGDRLNQQIQVEGVTRVRDTAAGAFLTAPPVTRTSPPATRSITPSRGSYRFPRRRGLATRADLDAYAAWLQGQIKARLEANEITTSRNDTLQLAPPP